MKAILSSLVPLLTVSVGLLANVLFNVVRAQSAKLDSARPAVKLGAVAVIAAAATVASHVVPGARVPADIHAWTADTISVLLSAAVAHLAHKAADPKGELRELR